MKIEDICYWRASEVSETLSGVYKFELVRYMHNSGACHIYMMWAVLGHSHFLYLPAVSNIATTGNGTGTKNILKWNRVLRFMYLSRLLSMALLL